MKIIKKIIPKQKKINCGLFTPSDRPPCDLF